MSRLKVTREIRTSALRRTRALMEGLMCFFMSRAQGTHHRETPFCREMRNCVKTFLKNVGNLSQGDRLAASPPRRGNHQFTPVSATGFGWQANRHELTEGNQRLQCQRDSQCFT